MGRTGFKILSWSPWPIQVSMGVLGVVSSFISSVHSGMGLLSLVAALASWIVLVGSLFCWWSDMVFEGNHKGDFTSRIKRNLQWGFVMFVVSEVFFFSSFFSSWYYFGVGENSQVLMGSWPPVGIVPVYPWKIPTLNTVLLLSSGVCVSWCQKCVQAMSMAKDSEFSKMVMVDRWEKLKFTSAKKMLVSLAKLVKKLSDQSAIEKKWLLGLRRQALLSMFLTISLGVIFMYLQSLEYRWASVTFSDSTYGGCFYILTGFHGLHVILGICFLSVCWVRIYLNNFMFEATLDVGLDCAILYWHFVDVVWIGVYGSVYLWPYFVG
uniref:Cytochrome c oxidase subunit 3 n=1 Tax=Ruditapes decussatus TaxID=104385 RepID=A0A219LV19_9BIVA|nr:cytochrome c oxidase subunit III [Ruditapes decussatus]AJY78600.1 cytochrome c oxidase subunit III [Ruditapes decussatus]